MLDCAIIVARPDAGVRKRRALRAKTLDVLAALPAVMRTKARRKPHGHRHRLHGVHLRWAHWLIMLDPRLLLHWLRTLTVSHHAPRGTPIPARELADASVDARDSEAVVPIAGTAM